MKYVFYILTMFLLFVGGILVGNSYLPDRSAVRAAAVSVPELNTENPVFSHTDRQSAEQELTILSQALASCTGAVSEEKDRLVNHVKLWLALEDFQLKKATLEREMAKNVESNRPTDEFVHAVEDYNAARTYAEQLADELFPRRTVAAPQAAAQSAQEPATAATAP